MWYKGDPGRDGPEGAPGAPGKPGAPAPPPVFASPMPYPPSNKGDYMGDEPDVVSANQEFFRMYDGG